MGSHLDRGLLLLGQSRHDLAEREFRAELAGDPEDGLTHALLALCLSEQGRHDEAARVAREAIRLAPDLDYPHYAMARVSYSNDRYPQAERAILEAIRLDPHDADYRGLRAAIYADQGLWEECLRSTEEGLEIDPDHVGCTNLRAMALVRLNRRDEAGATVAGALARDPDNALTHANQGWTLLHQGDPRRAFDHFRESLRLEPGSEWARRGIVEAMKARNPVYRLVLGFCLWMTRLGARAWWTVALAILFGPRLLRSVARVNPALKPWLDPVIYLILGFVFLTWVAEPLFDLLLRLDPFGRLALSRAQIVKSNWIGGCVLGAVLGLVAWLVTGNIAGAVAAVSCVLMMLPMRAAFDSPSGWRRRILVGYTTILALVLTGSIALVAVAARGGRPRAEDLAWGTVMLALFGAMLASLSDLVDARSR